MRLLTQAPVLANVELRADYRVTADSSQYALGAALLQRKKRRVVTASSLHIEKINGG